MAVGQKTGEPLPLSSCVGGTRRICAGVSKGSAFGCILGRSSWVEALAQPLLAHVGICRGHHVAQSLSPDLFLSFYRAFAQSLASENAARLMAMQAAEKNILELQEDLQALFREQRQAGITSELLDIISGFEALKEEELIESYKD